MNTPTIILIRNAYPYDFGGGERFPVHVAEILQERGYHPIVFSHSTAIQRYAADRQVQFKKSPWLQWQNWSGVRIIFTPLYIAWEVLLCIWYIITFLRYKPLAVHIQSKDDFIAATFAGRVTGVRVIWTDHADLKHIWRNVQTWYKNPIGKLVYLAANFSHAISVVSNSEYQEVTKHLPVSSKIKSKISVIYNGCPDIKIKRSIHKADSFIFCIASRLVTDKGIREAIEAFTLVQKKRKDVALYIIGSGPEADKFQSLAASNNAIIFMGHKKNPLPDMATSDVFLQPTYHEGFSIVLVEASMLGLPIIATNVGGNKEIIFHERTGLLVDARDSNQLSNAMLRLYDDATLRRRLAKNARKQYEQSFVFDTIVTTKFIPLYKGVSS